MERAAKMAPLVHFWQDLQISPEDPQEVREWASERVRNGPLIAEYPSSLKYPPITYLTVAMDPNFDWDPNLTRFVIAPHLGWADLYSLMRTCRSLYAWLHPVLMARARRIFGDWGTPMAFSFCRFITDGLANGGQSRLDHEIRSLFSLAQVYPLWRGFEKQRRWTLSHTLDYDIFENSLDPQMTKIVNIVRSLISNASASMERISFHQISHREFNVAKRLFIAERIKALFSSVGLDANALVTIYISGGSGATICALMFNPLCASFVYLMCFLCVPHLPSHPAVYLVELKRSVRERGCEWKRRVLCFKSIMDAGVCQNQFQFDMIYRWHPLLFAVVREYQLDDLDSVRRWVDWILDGRALQTLSNGRYHLSRDFVLTEANMHDLPRSAQAVRIDNICIFIVK